MNNELNIFKRMANATNEIQTVAKNLSVQVSKDNTYKAVGERDVLDAVKPIEFKHGIYSYPVKRTILNNEVIESETKYGLKKQIHYLIETVYRFVNVDDSNDFIETISYSDGIDTGDKAMGKAMTYGDKYALMKAYKIITGEDPDQEPSTEIKEVKATQKQIQMLKKYYVGENLIKLLNSNKIATIEELSKDKASELISKIVNNKKNQTEAYNEAINSKHEDFGDR